MGEKSKRNSERPELAESRHSRMTAYDPLLPLQFPIAVIRISIRSPVGGGAAPIALSSHAPARVRLLGRLRPFMSFDDD